MANTFQRDLQQLRGVLHLAERARSNYEILQQHRPLVDAIRRALAMLDRPHPADIPMQMAITAALQGVRFGPHGPADIAIVDRALWAWGMRELRRIWGDVND